jgi:hypothetical protein
MRSLLVVLALVAAASAQEMNPFGPYKGELARMQPPDWMKEGTRLQWEISTAIVGRDGTSSSGSGIISADIVSLVGTTAAVSVRTQVRSVTLQGAPILAAPREQGLILEGAAWGNEYWVHPDILAKTFKNLAVGGPWKGARGPYEVDGKKIPAYQFTAGGGPQDLTRQSLVYDEKTGILLFSITSQRRTAAEALQPTASNKFLGRRDRKLPWAMGRPPAWLGRIAAYQYTGSVTTEMPGVPPMQMPVSAMFTLQAAGKNFVALKLKFEQQMAGVPQAPLESVLVAGPTQVGGLWLPPLEIRKLRQGQACDEDRVTGAKVYVGYVGASQYGRRVVTIVDESDAYSTYLDYELETGLLLVVTIKDRALNLSTQVGFTGKERRAGAPGAAGPGAGPGAGQGGGQHGGGDQGGDDEGGGCDGCGWGCGCDGCGG